MRRGLLTDELKARVGSEVVYVAPEDVGRASIRYFARAVGDDNPLYTDDAFALRNGYPSVIAPPTFVCETNQFVDRPPGGDGYGGHEWDLDLAGLRPVRGGNRYELFRPLLPNDRVTTTWKLVDMTEKTASDGSPMLVVVSEATYTDAQGGLIARNTETLVYR